MSVDLLAAAVLAACAATWLLVAVVGRPQRGVLLLAALVPYDGLLLIVPHPALAEGWKEALVVVALAATFMTAPSQRGARGRRWPSWTAPLIGFLAVGLASAVVVGGLQAAVGLKINFFYALVALTVWRCPLAARDRDLLVTLLMVNGVVTSLVGLAQQAVGGVALNALGYEYGVTIRTASGVLRSFSTFNQPFPFALFLMLVLLVGIPVALTDLARWRNRVFLVLSPLLVVAMVTSIVRAALVALAVGAAFLAAHRYRVLLHALPPALIGLLVVPAGVYVALLSPSSLRQRAEGWLLVVDELLAAPFGNGIGSTGAASEKAAAVAEGVAASAATSGYQPDNYYVKTAYELGPLGLWLLLLFLLGVLFAAVRTSRRLQGQDAALAGGTAAVLLGALAASFVATYFEIFPLDVYFWLTLGVLTSLPSPPAPPDPLSPPAVRSSPSTRSPSVPAAAASRPTPAS